MSIQGGEGGLPYEGEPEPRVGHVSMAPPRRTPVNVLALDLAITTGWALMVDGELSSGIQAFVLTRDEPRGLRYVRFTRWLASVALHPSAGTPRIGLLVYEGAHHRGRAATEIALGLAAHVQGFGAAHGIETATVHTATLKKFVTGDGHAKKPAMIAAVNQRWKAVTDEDEADAIAVLYHALAE